MRMPLRDSVFSLRDIERVHVDPHLLSHMTASTRSGAFNTLPLVSSTDITPRAREVAKKFAADAISAVLKRARSSPSPAGPTGDTAHHPQQQQQQQHPTFLESPRVSELTTSPCVRGINPLASPADKVSSLQSADLNPNEADGNPFAVHLIASSRSGVAGAEPTPKNTGRREWSLSGATSSRSAVSSRGGPGPLAQLPPSPPSRDIDGSATGSNEALRLSMDLDLVDLGGGGCRDFSPRAASASGLYSVPQSTRAGAAQRGGFFNSAGLPRSASIGSFAISPRAPRLELLLNHCDSLVGSRAHSTVPGVLTPIIDNILYLGAYRDACDEALVHRYGIRAFICVAAEVMVPLPAFVQPCDIESGAVAFKHVKLQDGPSTLLAEHLHDVFGFIDEQISAGRPVAIYCQQGKSRSASLVAAYLMREYGIDSREALDLLHAVYPRADPNFFFLHQLDEIGVSLPPLPAHRRPSSDTEGGDDHAILSITSSSDPLHPLPPPPVFVTQRTAAMAEARAADDAAKNATTLPAPLASMTAMLAVVPDVGHLAPMSPDTLQTTQPPRSEVPSPVERAHQDDDSLSPLNAGFATVPSTPLVGPMTV
jgi:hypothetical protein